MLFQINSVFVRFILLTMFLCWYQSSINIKAIYSKKIGRKHNKYIQLLYLCTKIITTKNTKILCMLCNMVIWHHKKWTSNMCRIMWSNNSVFWWSFSVSIERYFFINWEIVSSYKYYLIGILLFFKVLNYLKLVVT